MSFRDLVLPALLLLSVVPARSATLLPLDSQDAALLPTGVVELTAGAERLVDFHPPFRDFDRREWAAPRIGIAAGLGSRAEVQATWEALHVEREIQGRRGSFEGSSSGDARLFTKIRLLSAGDLRRSWVPDTGFLFGVKLPNTNERFGTDQTDFFAHGLLAHTVPGGRLYANLGIGVLGNPGLVRVQDDVFLWSIAASSAPLASWVGQPISALAEITGVEGSRFGNDRRGARGGLRLGAAPLSAYLGGSVGFVPEGEDWGVRAGLIYELRAFSGS
jgi:hypothetical protein